jgi:hypothetical protein
MVKKMTCLVSLVLLLVQFENSSAQTMWSDSGPDHLWSTAENWSPQSVPTSLDPASIDSPDNTHCEIQDGIDAEC